MWCTHCTQFNKRHIASPCIKLTNYGSTTLDKTGWLYLHTIDSKIMSKITMDLNDRNNLYNQALLYHCN